MSADTPIVVSQSMLDALDRVIDARIKARAEAEREAKLNESRWECRPIWFWQVDRYLREGWTINQVGIGSWRDWLAALLSAINPTAVATFDRRTGERYDWSAGDCAAQDESEPTTDRLRDRMLAEISAPHRFETLQHLAAGSQKLADQLRLESARTSEPASSSPSPGGGGR